MRLITISYTGLNAGGGVPAFNRMLHSACPDVSPIHFCWDDMPLHMRSRHVSEWDRAAALNLHLTRSGLIHSDDLVVADGFWAAGLESIPSAVSVCHGIWSHLTYEDVLVGKQPDMPHHHAAQLAFRRSWMGAGRRTTAVSNFIADQMRLQWGLIVDAVIGNAVDTELFRPPDVWMGRERTIVVHGVNDRANLNKGWDHIEDLEYLNSSRFCDVVSLDELVHATGLPKHQALAQADVLVHPSGFEGHSVLLCEALACGVPIICYDVGFAQDLRSNSGHRTTVHPLVVREGLVRELCDYGMIQDRRVRAPIMTREMLLGWMSIGNRSQQSARCRALAERELGLDTFTRRWRGFLGLTSA